MEQNVCETPLIHIYSQSNFIVSIWNKMSVKPTWYTYILNPDCVKKNPNANFVEWSTSVYIDSVGNILLILPGQMKNHIVCIFTVFLQNEFSNASLNCLNERRQSCIGFIYSIFHNVLVFLWFLKLLEVTDAK